MFGTKNSFYYLIKTAFKINVACAKQDTNNYGGFAYDIFTKSLICSETLSELIFPKPKFISELSHKPIILYDVSSSYVLVRSMFESYVNMYYILEDNESIEEKEFKFLLWQRHSRQERRRMASFRQSKHPILDKEEKEIELINNNIIKNKYYDHLQTNDKKFYSNNNNWTNLNITKRAIRSGISNNNTRFIYKFLSSYAHSESFSTKIFGSVKSSKQAKEMIEGIPLMFTEAFLCMICDLTKPYFKQAKRIIDSEEYFRAIVNFWKDYLKKEEYTTHNIVDN